ncbi:SGNH/GDSL hydrolase family protein [Gordonia sp. PP30]|uniref:diglucosylglycerate octanoyltransferase n=1 Tax=Gordonia sp. PP30 TaxID=2935861 RepID=UPI001FFEB83B|nr:diglucosylglycerate octanoyltransferase [Gordonia sp. PP30]UQE73885.1 SGNH/GDSL hydrolase family protein [Gordonia sp. PP30]
MAPVASTAGEPGTILVLADSLSFYGPGGGLAADDGRIWPNLVGADTGRDVELFARIGWTSRDIWWAITQDPRVWAALPKADVVVLAFGGMDSLPSPLPTALREQIRYVRPAALRQKVRDAYGWVQPRLSWAGWPMALPPRVTVDYYEKIRGAIVHLRPGLPILVALPPTHASPYYGHAHPGRVPTSAAIAGWAAEHRLPTVDFYPVTAADFTDSPGEMNPDGIHWGLHTHRAIAALVAPAVTDLLTGPAESP